MAECRHPNIVLFLGLCMAPKDDGRCLWVNQLFFLISSYPQYSQSLTIIERISPTSSRIKPHSTLRIFQFNVARADSSIVSEYVPKGNLRSFMLGRRPFPWRLRLSFATDIARAIAYLHARDVRLSLAPFTSLISPSSQFCLAPHGAHLEFGWYQCVHRDIKGENLLITANDRIKVTDFGFARIMTSSSDEERARRQMTHCGTEVSCHPLLMCKVKKKTDNSSTWVLRWSMEKNSI